MYHTFEHDTQPSPTIIPSDDTHGTVDQDDNTIFYDTSSILLETTTKVSNYDLQRSLFAWIPTDLIKKTYELITQYARILMSTIFKKRYKSPNPALNIHKRNKPVATDTIYSDTPAVDSGVKQARIFVGCITMVNDVYPMKTDKQFVNTLEDNIREQGATNKLVSDSA